MRNRAFVVVAGFVVAAFLASGVVAEGYGGYSTSPGAREAQKSQYMSTETTSSALWEPMVVEGRLQGINPIRNEVVVNVEVAGLFGPEMTDVPLKIGRETSFSICFTGLGTCESGLSSKDGLKMLSDLQSFKSLGAVERNVIAVGEPDTKRIAHVQVDYDI